MRAEFDSNSEQGLAASYAFLSPYHTFDVQRIGRDCLTWQGMLATIYQTWHLIQLSCLMPAWTGLLAGPQARAAEV